MRSLKVLIPFLSLVLFLGFACTTSGPIVIEKEKTVEPGKKIAEDKIAFTSYRDGRYQIYIMDIDGSDQQNFRKTIKMPGPLSSHRMAPRSPFIPIVTETGRSIS